MARALDQEQHLMAATYHLLKAFATTDNLSSETKTYLSDLEARLPAMIVLHDDLEAAETLQEVKAKLVLTEYTILSLQSRHSMRDSNPATVSEYLQVAAEVHRLKAGLENMSLSGNSRIRELLDRAQSILQMVMAQLQGELARILDQNMQCFENGYVSPPIYEESVVSNEEDLMENQRVSSSTESEEYETDLINPDMIPKIKSIADVMFASGYDQEFCRTLTGFWRDTLFEHLTNLGMEHFSVEDVLQMEWKLLNSKIKKWCLAVKSIFSVYLAGVKHLFDHVLGEHGCMSTACLVNTSNAPLFCLLNFGFAVSMGPHGPEWLLCLLDMYKVLAALTPELDALFPRGTLIRSEFHQLLTRLGDSAKAICQEFGYRIASYPPETPPANGGVRKMTQYVINYILCYGEYGDTLNSLLQEQDNEDSEASPGEDVGQNLTCPLAKHLQSVISALEAALDSTSQLYRDHPLKHIFMMNNINYMVKKISDSKISCYFGDEWIRNHVRKLEKHAMSYQRATWNCILAHLHYDVKAGKVTLKANSRAFAATFEDIYKTQTRWLVKDDQLREKLRVLASVTVIPAYRNFFRKISDSIGEKYIKYTVHDIESYILDLLEGSPKSLNHLWKR